MSAALATGAIVILAVPVLSMKLSFPDESAQASGTMGRASYQTMAEGFGPGYDAPLIVAATLPGTGGTPATARLASAIGGTPGIARVTPPITSPDGKAVLLVAYPITGEQDPATNALVNQISSNVLPRATADTGLHAYLTGPNAGNVAFANMVAQRLPWLIGVVILLSTLLLTVVFRSVVVAVKAAVMNLRVHHRRVRRARSGQPVGLAAPVLRVPGEGAGHHLGADIPVRDPVRPVHGL